MHSERGFTLLEVLVAFVIASLALGVLFRSGSNALLSADTAGHYQEALARARSHLAALGAPGRLVASDRQGDDGGGYHWREHIAPVAVLPPGAPSGTAPRPGVTLYAVEVALSWAGHEIRLDTQRLGIEAVTRGP